MAYIASLRQNKRQRRSDSNPTPTTSILESSTQAAACSDCPIPNQVVLHLSTQVVISDYSLYYSTIPISSFPGPIYTPLGDGSLIASPYLVDLKAAKIDLAIFAVLTFIFARNMVTTAVNLRSKTVKRRSLFYMLFASQVLGFVACLPNFIAYYDDNVNCNSILKLFSAAMILSLTTLITGIFGIKAYRCLDRSYISLAVILSLRVAALILFALDFGTIVGIRRLCGSCVSAHDSPNLRYFVILQLAESAFICGCFFYCYVRSHSKRAVRGRLTLNSDFDFDPSTHELPVSETPRRSLGENSGRSENDHSVSSHLEKPQFTPSPNPTRKFFSWSKTPPPSAATARKSSIPGDVPIPQPPRPVSVADRVTRRFSKSRAPPEYPEVFPRMILFREVLRDELIATAFIAATCIVSTVLAVSGSTVQDQLTDSTWISINWAVISMAAVSSFDRVVQRHDREALLLHPSTWDAVIRAENSAESVRQQQGVVRPRRPWMSTGATQRRGIDPLETIPDDPLSAPQSLDLRSWSFETATKQTSVGGSSELGISPQARGHLASRGHRPSLQSTAEFLSPLAIPPNEGGNISIEDSQSVSAEGSACYIVDTRRDSEIDEEGPWSGGYRQFTSMDRIPQ